MGAMVNGFGVHDDNDDDDGGGDDQRRDANADDFGDFEEAEGGSEEDEEGAGSNKFEEIPGFSPPLYIQRYERMAEILGDSRYANHMLKVMDVGCAECKLVSRLKSLPRVREIIAVDVDREVLTVDSTLRNCEPLAYDYLARRPHCPLDIIVMCGSVVEPDPRWTAGDVDVVTAIEVIEHLVPDVLSGVPAAIFGAIRPKLAVLTTPNSEFNFHFGPDFEGFRHWDHKFEWTRQEFADWCAGVLDAYPDYDVRFDGVGYVGDRRNGPCSQIAVFERRDFMERVRNGETVEPPADAVLERYRLIGDYSEDLDGAFTAETLHRWTIPRKPAETRSPDELAHDEIMYYARQMAYDSQEWAEDREARIPLQTIMDFDRVRELGRSINDLSSALQGRGVRVEEDSTATGKKIVLVLAPPEEAEPELNEDSDDEPAENVPVQAEAEESWD